VIRSLPTILAIAVLAGCASTGPFGRVPVEPVVFPPPPDSARVQFLLTVTNDMDVQGGGKRGLLSNLMPREISRTTINKPYGVDWHDGKFYVCDSMLPGVDIIDVRAQEFRAWRPDGRGALEKPINCAVDHADGRLYVTDTGRRQVVVFDSAGSYVHSFGDHEGTPVGVHADAEGIWVSDVQSGQIHVYDKASYALVRSFPDQEATDQPRLKQPQNLTVQDSLVFVSDFGNFDVKVYRRDGKYLRTIGGFGRQLGQFVRPKGIAADREGRVYVADAGFQNVQVFSPEGELLMFFGGTYSGVGTMWLPAKVTIRYTDLELFRDYVEPGFELEYLILVTNQYGPDRLNVYGFVRPAGAGAG